MLEQSEKDFPKDYNPPARLALVYLRLKKYDEALAASDRALELRLRARGASACSRCGPTSMPDEGDAAAARKTLRGGPGVRRGAPGRAALGVARSRRCRRSSTQTRRQARSLDRVQADCAGRLLPCALCARRGTLPGAARGHGAVGSAADAPPRPPSRPSSTRQWEFRLAEDPLFATNAGDHRYGDRLPSMTPADFARREAFARSMLRRLEAVDAATLSTPDRVSRDMLVRELTHEIAGYEFGTYRIPLNADSGFQTDFADLPNRNPFRNAADYENYIARLNAFPRFASQEMALMRAGARRGLLAVALRSRGARRHDAGPRRGGPREERLLRAVPRVPRRRAGGGAGAADGRRAGARSRESVVPAYRALAEFMRDEYVTEARGPPSAPRSCRADASTTPTSCATTRRSTSRRSRSTRSGSPRSPASAPRWKRSSRKTGFQGSFAEFLAFLRTDPRFYAPTAEELLKTACASSKKADGSLPALFGRLPRLPYTVEPVPAHLAPKYTGGRYVEAPADGTRAGIYWVNTYALDKRPLYTLEALTLHEAVPGHHLQVALSQELTGLPPVPPLLRRRERSARAGRSTRNGSGARPASTRTLTANSDA